MRVARRAGATLLVAFALSCFGGSAVLAPALAATPTPSPDLARSSIVNYTGTGITTNPEHPEYAQNADTLVATATVDCTTSPCTVTATVTDADNGRLLSMTNGAGVPLRGGKADVAVGGPADAICTEAAFPPGEFTATATGDSITVTRTFEVAKTQTCSDGSTTQTIGGYVFVATLTAPAGAGCVATESCPSPEPTATPSATPIALVAGGPGTPRFIPHAVRLADPSVLSALPTAATALAPANILWAAAATVVLVLLIALPSHLLNSATEAGTDRVTAWWRATRRRVTRARRAEREGGSAEAESDAKPVNLAGWPLAAAGVLAASLISSFVDPGFGLNPASIRVFLSILLSFLLDAVLGWFLLIALVRRANPHATARFHFTPASLLVVAVAVLFTRLTGFAPGIIFGLVAGVAFGAIVATADKARLALVSLGYSFVLALVGWVGYSFIVATAGAHPSAPLLFVRETFSSMAIGGIVALPLVLVPVRGMAGFSIWRWNRAVWVAAYAIGLLGFFLVLMPKPFSWTTVSLSVWTWAGIYLSYAVVAIVLWLALTRPWRRGEGEETPVPAQRADVQSPDAAAGA